MKGNVHILIWLSWSRENSRNETLFHKEKNILIASLNTDLSCWRETKRAPLSSELWTGAALSPVCSAHRLRARGARKTLVVSPARIFPARVETGPLASLGMP
ncbi:hypothetical protein BaRGS_00008497 [Batillaria attramentaria]|uniref:Uncharacterized protein n=1 Tax=Batillaria attramentaria TaxID=370345 RepID=A0ABD0LMP4_9CAEN